MAYVPPWKRAQGSSPDSHGVPPAPQRKLKDLEAQTSRASTFTLSELEQRVGSKQGTLTPFTNQRPDSPQLPSDPPIAAHPLAHLICYVTLFPHAHPEWPHTLWFHTNAGLLDDPFNIGRPIPCIKQVGHGPGPRPKFTFDSWIKITDVRKLDPEADREELIEILKEKSKEGAYRTGRPERAWKESLDTIWIKASVVPVVGELENPFHPLNEGSLRYIEDRAEEYVQRETATPPT